MSLSKALIGHNSNTDQGTVHNNNKINSREHRCLGFLKVDSRNYTSPNIHKKLVTHNESNNSNLVLWKSEDHVQ